MRGAISGSCQDAVTIIVHGHTPVTPPRRGDHRKSDLAGYPRVDTDILSMATFDIARETIESFRLTNMRSGRAVQNSVCIDREPRVPPGLQYQVR